MNIKKQKSNQQPFNVNSGSNLLQHPQSQQPSHTEMLRNSSFTNAANLTLSRYKINQQALVIIYLYILGPFINVIIIL